MPPQQSDRLLDLIDHGLSFSAHVWNPGSFAAAYLAIRDGIIQSHEVLVLAQSYGPVAQIPPLLPWVSVARRLRGWRADVEQGQSFVPLGEDICEGPVPGCALLHGNDGGFSIGKHDRNVQPRVSLE